MRIIAGVSVLNNRVVQSRQWNVTQVVGTLEHVLRSLDRYEVDEIIVNNIRRKSIIEEKSLLASIRGAEVFTPLSLGGGIRRKADFDQYYQASPERIFFTTALMNQDEELLEYACSIIGQQGMIAFLPFKADQHDTLFFNPSNNQFELLTKPIQHLMRTYFDEVVFYNTRAEGELSNISAVTSAIASISPYRSDQNGLIYAGGIRPDLLSELPKVADGIIIENALMYQEEPLKMHQLAGRA